MAAATCRLFAIRRCRGGATWISHKSDKEEQRATLINDMLWLEQNLYFQLVRNEEILAQIGLQQVANPSRFESHARALLANGTGLTQIFWIDPGGKIVRAAPSARSDYMVGEEQGVVTCAVITAADKSTWKA